MRRKILGLVIGGSLAVLATLSGCPAAHDDYPGTSCMSNSDCYQGEICTMAGMCVPNTDMTVILPDLAHFFGDGGPPPSDLSANDMTQGDDL